MKDDVLPPPCLTLGVLVNWAQCSAADLSTQLRRSRMTLGPSDVRFLSK